MEPPYALTEVRVPYAVKCYAEPYLVAGLSHVKVLVSMLYGQNLFCFAKRYQRSSFFFLMDESKGFKTSQRFLEYVLVAWMDTINTELAVYFGQFWSVKCCFVIRFLLLSPWGLWLLSEIHHNICTEFSVKACNLSISRRMERPKTFKVVTRKNTIGKCDLILLIIGLS